MGIITLFAFISMPSNLVPNLGNEYSVVWTIIESDYTLLSFFIVRVN